MSTYAMANGLVKKDAITVAELMGYQYSDKVALTRDDNALDTTESYKVGKKSGSGRIRCHYDYTDATGQKTLRSGASVALHIIPGGTGAGKPDLTGTVIITDFAVTGENEGIVEAEFGFTGILTETSLGA